jgi:hypothetical protein
MLIFESSPAMTKSGIATIGVVAQSFQPRMQIVAEIENMCYVLLLRRIQASWAARGARSSVLDDLN